MRRLRIRTKLLLAVGLPLLVLVPLGVLATDTFLQTRVGGPLYDDIAEHQELVGDTRAPGLSLDPAYTAIIDLGASGITGDAERLDQADQSVADAESSFRKHERLWTRRLEANAADDPRAASALEALERSKATADEFFELFHDATPDILPD